MKTIENYVVKKLTTTDELKSISKQISSDYIFLITSENKINFTRFAAERMLQIAGDSGAGILYSDYLIHSAGATEQFPLTDYQLGSLRDDFNFGPIIMIKSSAFLDAIESMDKNYQYAALYDLRLRISINHPIIHLNEYIYTEEINSDSDKDDTHFAYVDPQNRSVQIEMEDVCSNYLKKIGAYLNPEFKPVHFDEDQFDFEASIIIPVFNREKTIEDAIKSALSQETTFNYNLIIIDNHSDDGTTEIIKKYTKDRRIIHIIPQERNLNIGGCWNLAIHHTNCGKFAVQLDSDDLYAGSDVLEKIIQSFHQQQCAMIIGSYKIVDFNLKMIPPGIIEHKEWTPENGRNNALRINGLGAPRAFYTPLLRQLNLPNTSYGEDYAIGLRISREYQIGRIYDVLYLCRRWENNSDANLNNQKINQFNTYKDKLRTWEILARIRN